MKSHGAHDHLSVAFLSTYPPTQCGIATFTRDLSRAIVGADPDISRTIVAMDKPDESLVYPDYTERRIRRGVKMDYIRAAESVSYSDVGVVSVQHEYGIFGGADPGAYLALLRRLADSIERVEPAATDSELPPFAASEARDLLAAVRGLR